MGIIIKQSIKGTIWSYLGVVIGFVTTGYLYPEYLTPEVVGLFALLLTWANLLAQFSALGFNGITSRMFPHFRNKENGHNGFLFIALGSMLLGFLLFLVFFFLFSPVLVERNLEKSQLFSEYVYLLVPLTFFTLLYNQLDAFNKLLYNAVFGTFLVEFLQRLFIFASIVIYIFGWINLNQLVIIYASVVSIKGLIIFVYLIRRGEISIKPKLDFIDKKLRKEMMSVAFFSILTGVGGNIVFSLDKIIINQMLGLADTGVYTIAFFFGTLVVIPSRPLLRISGTLIADAWKRNDVDYIADIYRRSCLNQFIIAAFLFGGIWVNIDNILVILGPDYAHGKWVIFFIGLGYLVDMATGANDLVIGYSRYYRMGLWFLLILVTVVVITMYLLIPVWGITGAAISITISIFLNNIMRFIFLFKKYKMQPFNYRFLLIIIIFLIAYFTVYMFPESRLIWDILIRSAFFSVIFVLLVVLLNISEDINKTVKKFIIFITMNR